MLTLPFPSQSARRAAMMVCTSALALLGLGCTVNPDYPAGLSCEDGRCPDGQVCVDQLCVLGADAAPAAPDAPADHPGQLVRSPTQPILVNGPGAFDAFSVGQPVVLSVASRHMWYAATPAEGAPSSIAHATSNDWITWDKHGVVITATEAWEGDAVWPGSVLYAEDTYHLWYSTSSGKIGYASSPDGTDWTKSPANPVLEPAGSWASAALSDPRVGVRGSGFLMIYRGCSASAGPCAWGRALSDDGIAWTQRDTLSPFVSATEPWEEGDLGSFGYAQQGGPIFPAWYLSGGDGIGHVVIEFDNDNWTKSAGNPVLLPSTAADAPDRHIGDSIFAQNISPDQVGVFYGCSNEAVEVTPPQTLRGICRAVSVAAQ